MSRRKICVVTTTRADYGLLSGLMRAIFEDAELELSIIVTGMHLSTEFGRTVDIIEAEGFPVLKRVEMLLGSDSATAVAKSMGVGLISFADVLNELEPDIIVILGDRFEIVPVALAALVLKIPIAHIHGGETSQGAMDESFRHAVTKIAQIHFPATEIYRQRILQMGEDPSVVFNFGSPGLDAIYHIELLKRSELEKELAFDLKGTVAIVTYHPVTLEIDTALLHIDNLLQAIRNINIRCVFTKANADIGSSSINYRLAAFCRKNPDRFKLFDSLGQQKYLSCLKNLDLVIGNSSSGLIEGPSFGLPVLNIGDRQKGRIKAKNIIDVGNEVEEIVQGITRALSQEFRNILHNIENPYDRYRDGKTSLRIKDKLKTIDISENLMKKPFRDLIWEDSFGTNASG